MAIKLSTTISIDGGPSISVAASLDVDAYDVIEKEVGSASSVTLPVQPEAAGKVQLMFIKASAYPETSSELTYKATDDSGGDLSPVASQFELDQPQAFSGDAVKGVADEPKYLTITNNSDSDVTVMIIVGRSAG